MSESGRKGRSHEKEVLAALRSRINHYQVLEQALITTNGRHTRTRADAVLSVNLGGRTLDILVESKALRGNANQAHVKVVESDLRNHGFRLGLIVTEQGLQSGATNVVRDHPNILHLTLDKLKEAIASGGLDDQICLG